VAKESQSISRREALAKLAKLSVYSAPTVTVLLTGQKSYAQTSEANNGYSDGNLPPGNASKVAQCLAMNRANLAGNLGNNAGGNNNSDTESDCGL